MPNGGRKDNLWISDHGTLAPKHARLKRRAASLQIKFTRTTTCCAPRLSACSRPLHSQRDLFGSLLLSWQVRLQCSASRARTLPTTADLHAEPSNASLSPSGVTEFTARRRAKRVYTEDLVLPLRSKSNLHACKKHLRVLTSFKLATIRYYNYFVVQINHYCQQRSPSSSCKGFAFRRKSNGSNFQS